MRFNLSCNNSKRKEVRVWHTDAEQSAVDMAAAIPAARPVAERGAEHAADNFLNSLENVSPFYQKKIIKEKKGKVFYYVLQDQKETEEDFDDRRKSACDGYVR